MTEAERIELVARRLIQRVKDTAFSMSAPNDWTPVFVMDAVTAENEINRILSEDTGNAGIEERQR